jgi:hypothetical protein
MHVSRKLTVPALRWRAVALTRGDLVAAIEGRSVPSDTWCADLVAAHARVPQAPAIGGPVALKPGATAFDWGLYFSEFAPFAPPVPEGPSAQISGANLSYKRAALDGCRDLMDLGLWEAALHERWRSRGEPLWLSRAAVVFHNGMTRAEAIRMRFHYGRSYAADRFRDRPRTVAVVYALLTPVLPALLAWRAARHAARAGLTGRFVAGLPWLAALNTAWACGEMAGYLFGRAADAEIF